MEIYRILSEVVLLLFLFAAAFMDFRSGQLSLWFLLGAMAAGLLLRIIVGSISIKSLLLGIIPGAVLFLIALLTKQAIGYGDCLLLVVTGIFLGLTFTILLFLISLLFAGAASILLLAMKKRKRKEALAFAPFILAGYVGVLLLS
jgi:leader peptidase (prepilin peptidase)/N-methyltransferase